ncbi:MAG: hypothetical protein RLZZ624_86 [Cyanobacteriota bacterium]|jgi:hypothetical protein
MGTPIDRDTFLARAIARFGDHYDYSEIVYKSYKTPIRIRCTVHPVKPVSITPERHLQTTGGCKFCLKTSRSQIVPLGDSFGRLMRERSTPEAAPVQTSLQTTLETSQPTVIEASASSADPPVRRTASSGDVSSRTSRL